MEHEDKNIDRLFQEKFKDFEALPNNAVWNNIQAKLDEEDDNAIPLIPWWLGRSAAVALFLIGMGILMYFNPPQKTANDSYVTSPEVILGTENKKNLSDPTTQNETTTVDVLVENDAVHISAEENTPEINKTAIANDVIANSKQQSDAIISTNKNTFNAGKNASKKYSYQNNNFSTKYRNDKTFKKRKELAYPEEPENENYIATATPNVAAKNKVLGTNTTTGTTLTKQNNNSTLRVIIDTTVTTNAYASNNYLPVNIEKEKLDSLLMEEAVLAEEALTLEEAIRKQQEKYNDPEEDEKEDKLAGMKKWSINPNVAPVYFNSISDGSPISGDFASNGKTGHVNMSYGINVGMQVDKRFKIRSGVSKVNYGYATENVYFTNTSQSQAISSINYSESGATIAMATNTDDLTSTNVSDGLIDVTESNASVEKYKGALIQNMDYIEIPVELEYQLIDAKFGVNLIGGLSTLILSNNEILLESDGLITAIGKSNNINTLNLSTNIGLGINYTFTNRLSFNVEPMFKYQLNTFADDNGFKPYTLGLYTGFSFRF
ncbi:hypothetical protein NBRC110019_18900 [Neptunitalea chrysea]|uniref:Outer membrane protein beta-barrel domain-containing protein n=1 Tax=Neptunitalea chrysea TaxID=1647581 RepID=A0A9W6EU04_9FLAO|nr:hypothetical protein [Neptunitalea chrysea]GLB52850.1 hypothetical protein NBRC110019_18900 [Neptunitalea chrysea]